MFDPIPVWTGLRFCRDCNTGTLHREWAFMDEDDVIECEGCGGIWLMT